MKQINLEPAYLRYIYDSLAQGKLSADNAANLPHGFTGIFEDRLGALVPAGIKQDQLKIFACFALLKKEVSINFVAHVLKKEQTAIKVIV